MKTITDLKEKYAIPYTSLEYLRGGGDPEDPEIDPDARPFPPDDDTVMMIIVPIGVKLTS